MIKEIFMMSNGSIICLDENNEQVKEVQDNVFTIHLKILKEKNLVDDSTIVHANYTTNPISFWIGEQEKTDG